MQIAVKMIPEFSKFYSSLKKDDYFKEKIDYAADLMKKNDNRGDKIKKKLWPKQYQKKFGITNLWRYDIGNHRLIYTITVNNNEKIYLLLRFLTHPEYDALFDYNTT
jgi:hypothetical protein